MCRAGGAPGRYEREVVRARTDPLVVVGVPGLAGVRVGDGGLARRGDGDLDGVEHLRRCAAVDPGRDDGVDVGSNGERLGQRLAGTGEAVGDRVREPRGGVVLVDELRQYRRLVDVGNRLDGEQSGSADSSSSIRGRWKSRNWVAVRPYRPRYSEPSPSTAPYGPMDAATFAPG